MAFNTSAANGNARVFWNPFTVLDFPFSMACIASHNSVATEGHAAGFFKYNADVASHFIGFRGDLSGDPIAVRRIPNASTSGGSNSPQSAAFAANTPYRIVAVWAAANDVRLYANGSKTTTTVSVDYPAAADGIGIGSFWGASGVSARLGGDVQQVAMWSAALTDDDVAQFTAGFSPRRIRPDALELYVPCVRGYQTPLGGDGVSAANLTITPHQRSYGF